MRLLGKTTIVLGVIGAVALGSMTASEARHRGWVAGAAGFAAGAAVGAAAANANAAYYGPGYYADSPSYAYTGDPAYAYSYGSGYGYAPGPSYGYGYGYDSSYSYNSNTTSPMRERVLEGHDY
jgi:hypothetical protein